MRIFLYEFMTGGGWYHHDPLPPSGSLLAEGSAMLQALAADFLAIPGVQLETLRDARLEKWNLLGCNVRAIHGREEELEQFRDCARRADWSVAIAPEFNGFLHERAAMVESAGGKLLGPSPALAALAADKHATAEHLASDGIKTPRGVSLGLGEALPHGFPYPAVLKPSEGAGSRGIELLERPIMDKRVGPGQWRLEEFCPGTPASVSLLCGPKQKLVLAPCAQHLSSDGRLSYLGGRLPLAHALAHRAVSLARRAAATLGESLGYLGIDLVLGEDSSGADDQVIEINPRLTTSYVGLRALSQVNLADAMLDVAEGRGVELCWKKGALEFDAMGCVRWLSQ